MKSLDNTNNYSVIGGSLAFAVTIASMESASKSLEQPLFKILSNDSDVKCPFPLGNILGGGAHAGPGTPDIQEILICATGSKTIEDAIEINLAVHKEFTKSFRKRRSQLYKWKRRRRWMGTKIRKSKSTRSFSKGL